MNRTDFMKELEILLSDITEAEKEEALTYYNEYFDDAGVENEAEVITSLSSPKEVYKTIIEGLDSKENDTKQFTERGFFDGTQEREEVSVSGERVNEKRQSSKQTGPNQKGLKTILIILAIVVLFPAWFPLIMGIFGAAMGLIFGGLGVLIAITAVGIVLLVAGCTLFAVAIVKLFTLPILGICIMGISFMLIAIGIILTILNVWIWKTVVPAVLRGIIKLCRMPFERRERTA